MQPRFKDFREMCRTLRQQGYTLGEIVSFTRRPKTSVYFHIQDIKLPETIRQKIAERHTERINNFSRSRKGKNPQGRHPKEFTLWDQNLVCLVAHLLFDGEMNYNRCVYTNRSTALIDRVQHLMRIVYDYEPKRIESLPGVYRISYNNVELRSYLKDKSQELLRSVSIMDQELQRAFLQAFFDDEGSMYWIRKKRVVRGYQHSLRRLILVHNLLHRFNIMSHIDAKYFEITISRRENIERFAKEINFSPGLTVNGMRSNSIWKRSLEKREILKMALDSYHVK